jgi:hypothetical protein
VNIDGKRLRGLRLERARALLASSRNVVDAVISRTAPAAGPLQLAAAAATAAAAVDKEQEQAKDDLIRLTGSLSSEEEEEVVRPTIITIGTEEVQMDEEEGDEGEVGGGRGVELVHTTVDTPQVHHYTANEGPVIPIYVFPEKKLLFPKQIYNSLSSSNYTHISVRDLYIHRIDLPVLLQENIWTDAGNI